MDIPYLAYANEQFNNFFISYGFQPWIPILAISVLIAYLINSRAKISTGTVFMTVMFYAAFKFFGFG